MRLGLLLVAAALLPACAPTNVDNMRPDVVSLERIQKKLKPEQSKEYDIALADKLPAAIIKTFNDLGYEIKIQEDTLGLYTAEISEDVDQGAEFAKNAFLLIMVGTTTESPDIRVYQSSVTVRQSQDDDKIKLVVEKRVQGRGEYHNGHITNAYTLTTGSYYKSFFTKLDENLRPEAS